MQRRPVCIKGRDEGVVCIMRSERSAGVESRRAWLQGGHSEALALVLTTVGSLTWSIFSRRVT